MGIFGKLPNVLQLTEPLPLPIAAELPPQLKPCAHLVQHVPVLQPGRLGTCCGESQLQRGLNENLVA